MKELLAIRSFRLLRTPTLHRTVPRSNQLHPSSFLPPLPSLALPLPCQLLPPFRTPPLMLLAYKPHRRVRKRLEPSRPPSSPCLDGNGATATWAWERGRPLPRRISWAKRQRQWTRTDQAYGLRRHRQRWVWACRRRASRQRRGHRWLRRSTRRLDLLLEVSRISHCYSEAPSTLLLRSPLSSCCYLFALWWSTGARIDSSSEIAMRIFI